MRPKSTLDLHCHENRAEHAAKAPFERKLNWPIEQMSLRSAWLQYSKRGCAETMTDSLAETACRLSPFLRKPKELFRRGPLPAPATKATQSAKLQRLHREGTAQPEPLAVCPRESSALKEATM
jgi:hypothetical protein